MKRKIFSLLLCVVMLLSMLAVCVFPASAATKTQSQAVTWIKEKVGQYLDYDGVYGAQCVDLIFYYYDFLGVGAIGGSGSHYSWNALPSGWQRIKYYSGFIAQPGDIAVWTWTSLGGDNGHVALVTSATSSNMTVVDQNGSGHVSGGYSTYSYGSSSMSFYGVIRPSFISSPTYTYTTISGGNYFLHNTKTDKFLCVNNGIDQSGQNVHTYYFANTSAFMMNISARSTGYAIRPLCCTSRLVNPDGVTVTSGQNVNIYDDVNDSSEWWRFQKVDGGYVIHNVQNENCVLDVDEYDNVVVANYVKGNKSQIWQLGPVNDVPAKPRYVCSVNGNAITVSISSYKSTEYYDIYIRNASNNEIVYKKINIGGASHTVTLNEGSYKVEVWGVNKAAGMYTQGDTTSVKIEKPVLTSIEVVRNPDQSDYLEGIGELNLSGSLLRVTYSDRSQKDIEIAESMVSGFNNRIVGTQTLTVTYGGLTDTFKVTVSHYYNTRVRKSPTCNSAGYTTYICGACDYSYISDYEPATGDHVDGGFYIDTAPSCIATGTGHKECIYCGEILENIITPPDPIAHEWEISYTIDKPAKCNESGTKSRYCKLCGEQKGKSTVVIPATGKHSWNKGTITQKPTTSKTGVKTYSCTICGTTKSEKIAKLPKEVKLAFTDVKNGAYYKSAVDWAVKNGVTTGTSATKFSPEEKCTRAQIVTFLWRAVGSPKVKAGNVAFTDIKKGSYYFDAVIWAVKNGVTAGTTKSTFEPDSVCTRAQIVTFLWRAQGSKKANAANPFTDVKSSDYYCHAVLWAVKNGITTGTSATKFGPDEACTRAQCVTFLYRAQ